MIDALTLQYNIHTFGMFVKGNKVRNPSHLLTSLLMAQDRSTLSEGDSLTGFGSADCAVRVFKTRAAIVSSQPTVE